MPKRIKQRRRGRGGTAFRSPGFRFLGKVGYRQLDSREKQGAVVGHIVDILHDRGRSAPVAKVKFEDNSEVLLPATKGTMVNERLEEGAMAGTKNGNILPLSKISEGTVVSNVEARPGDGGKYMRGAGCSATVVTREQDKVIIQMSSGELKVFDPNCRATIGAVAGSGRTEKPFVKAGKHYFAAKSRNKFWPIVAGSAMNPRDHPFGQKGRRTHKPKSVSRNAVPGQKVGSIAPKRTGKKR